MASDSKVAKPVEGFSDQAAQEAIEEMDNLQNDVERLNEQASEEILKVEQKYNKLRLPYLKKRSDVISKIPNFWVTVFMNHPQMSPLIQPDDEEALQYLSKVEVHEFDDIKSGFKINFFFAKNPFFKNEVLIKEVHLTKASPVCKIEWLPGKDLTESANAANQQKNSFGKRTRSHVQSFFVWFTEQTTMSTDEIGEIIKDDVWLNPLQYYLGMEGGDDEEEELDDEELEGEDDDEDGGEDEDLDEEVAGPDV